MLGLALGLAFLSGFGLGAVAVVIWAGLGSLVLARKSMSVAAVTVIVVAAVGGAGYAHLTSAPAAIGLAPGPFEGVVQVIDGPFLTQSGQRYTMRPELGSDTVLCAYAGPEPRPLTHDRVFVQGAITLLPDLSDLGDVAVRIRGCDAQLRVRWMRILERSSGVPAQLSRFRVALSDSLMRSASGDTGALLSGLVTGDDGALSGSASRAFLSSGTTHITAISGANFATLTLLLGVLATSSMRRNVLFVTGASIIIWLYALMVGLEPSALRAALLAIAVLIGRWIGRRPDVLTLTVLLAALQVILRPADFATLAFQLSLSATVALIMVFDGMGENQRWSWLATLGMTIFAAQLATVPILAWTIGTMSGVGLLANLVVGPLAGLAFPIALAGGMLMQVWPFLGEAVLLPAIALCRGILAFVEWSDRTLPGTVQLGEPTTIATVAIGLSCWLTVFWLSGDLRRASRHGLAIARSW